VRIAASKRNERVRSRRERETVHQRAAKVLYSGLRLSSAASVNAIENGTIESKHYATTMRSE
jgi:hypothetical protein